MSEAQKRTLMVTECKPVYSGVSGSTGREYTIYEVSAIDADGDPVDATLKSFDELPVGELTEFEITKRETEKYGVEYTLRVPGPRGGNGGGGLGKSVDELRERIERIEAQLGLGGATDVPSDASDFAPAPMATAATSSYGSAPTTDDDIPF